LEERIGWVVDRVDVELILMMKFWAAAKVANGELCTLQQTSYVERTYVFIVRT